MKTIDVVEEIRELAALQRGAFSATQVLALGATTALLRARWRRGEWLKRGRGLFVVAGAPACWKQDLWLAHLSAGPTSVICGRAAARLHRLRGHYAPAVEVLVPIGGDHRGPLGRVRETRWLPPEHVVLIDGLPVTSVARTIFDLAGDPPRPRTFRNEVRREAHKREIAPIFSRALQRNGLTMIGMMRTVAALGRRGRAGTKIMRELVVEFGEDYIPTGSDLEDLFLDLARADGLEEPVHQFQVTGVEGWLGCVDFAYVLERIIIEIDGPDHDAPLQRRYDAQRDEAMGAAGWTVIRINWLDLVTDPDGVVARIRKALAAASA